MRILKILVAGIGNTGKSTVRRIMADSLRKLGLSVDHYDADEFRELRDPKDAGCLRKLPESFLDETIYIIEDIHAFSPSAVLSLSEYDLILYIRTNIISHLMFWIPRIAIWFKRGKLSWEKGRGWKGTGKPYDFRNLIPILKDLFRNFKNRKKWIEEDMRKINSHPHIVVQSRWSKKRPKFRLDI